jgi:ABC-type phosphate transport system auxiliary subunit
MKKEKSIGLLELQAEKAKLEGDRAVLGERLQALKAESEKSSQQLIMIAGALQAIDHLIQTVDPEISLEEEVEANLSLDEEK